MPEPIKINAKYLPLWTADYRYAILSGGRGSAKSSAKSFSGGCFASDLTYQSGHKILSTRYTMTSAKKSVIPEFRHKLECRPSPYNNAPNRVEDFALVENTFTNRFSQSELMFSGIKTSSGIQTANLKSIEGLTTWIMEEAEELIDDGTETEACTFDKIDDSIRKAGVRLRTILLWNPSDEESFVYQRFFKERGVDITFNGIKDDVLYIYTTYHDNRENLNDSFIAKAERIKAMNPDRYKHIYGGIPIAENAPFRVNTAPELKRIVIGVDPAVTSTGNQDETGIVVAGQGFNGEYYVLKDGSAQYTTSEWGKAAVGEYKDSSADRIIAEVNNGGDLVEMNITNTDRTLKDRVKKVRASRGKVKRAEPIAALYEEGKVHHVGMFSEMEGEMTSYTGADNDDSPNRLDALVWALTELSQGESGDPILVSLG
jgi:phage terminase large subunit-like protein